MRQTRPVASGSEGRITLRLAGSIDDAVAPFRSLQWMLAVITLLGLALFGAGSLWTARRVTQPLRRLVQASERLGRGDDVVRMLVKQNEKIGVAR